MTIRQTICLPASPAKVYAALTSAGPFAEFTGAPAEISGDDGGAFSCFGGQITGRHIELLPNRRVVQAWRVKAWPDGHYSIVRFDIEGAGNSTTLELQQTGYPDDAASHLEPGWHKMYWDPLRTYLV